MGGVLAERIGQEEESGGGGEWGRGEEGSGGGGEW